MVELASMDISPTTAPVRKITMGNTVNVRKLLKNLLSQVLSPTKNIGNIDNLLAKS